MSSSKRSRSTNDGIGGGGDSSDIHHSKKARKTGAGDDTKLMKRFDSDLAKADAIDEMRSSEDLIWRFFGGNQREVTTRMYVLKKIVALLREKYGRQVSHFKFTTEMFDYFESLATEECRATNEQDFFFFGALLFLPELFRWIKENQHNNNNNAATNTQPMYDNKTVAIATVSASTRLKSNKGAYTSRSESTATEQVTNLSVFSMKQFVAYINNAIKTNVLEIMHGSNNYDLDTVVRELRYEYIAYCGVPVPSPEFLDEWTTHLERKALVETTKDHEQDNNSD